MSIHQDTLERINAKIAQLKALDTAQNLFGAESHNYEIQAPLSDTTISQFEKSHQITLPPAYRVFLQQIGNGGTGPYYGLESLEDGVFASLDYKEAKYGLQNLSQPFPHTDEWNLPGDVYNMSEEEYLAWQEECFQDDIANGLLRIANFGCGISINLVVNGDAYGEIWVDDRCNDNGIYPDFYFGNESRLDFLAWYELWLDISIKEMEN
ncbi:SMI1/KNR4 family protein [Listeria seeligeri]|uniref:SMI1/KNR4 family protein n=1 Tax=Listeria seeligeri TaxID=1640 RepID=UPI0022EBC2CB|nr:SMI1/KNR4 family protein [Listeria seeligeri]